MFYHVKDLQYNAKPACPDPVYAKKLQEVLGGQYGEITVMMQYLFQGFNCRADAKYRDLLFDIGTEEIAHVEMLATLIARLLDNAPAKDQEQLVNSDPAIAAIMGGMNPQHAIVSGLGALPADSVGYPWNARYTIASGNLLADFRANLNAESQGRLQVSRLYELTDDPGVRDTLSFLIARDNAHQNQWIAAIRELESEEGDIIVPTTFPRNLQKEEVAYDFYNTSQGNESSHGPWAQGLAPDHRYYFRYVENPVPYGPRPYLIPAPYYLFNTPPMLRA
ncbi:Mn-containing catalase [Salibacterium salarium]|uniref:Manganese catalase family protein n=1 Tax=Salibacterium salarium TaxID=284579 RepID=A0A428MXF2_9BACI|nr:manganese catalase family protein [Salibacterium salarium]MDQ0298869.1 Mn-containing catalase [Salibacterium salarium]RSL30821.1 manganese catalase family protein [Salibacterium salarium]